MREVKAAPTADESEPASNNTSNSSLSSKFVNPEAPPEALMQSSKNVLGSLSVVSEKKKRLT